MMKDGIDEEYYRYNVSLVQEKLWENEMIEESFDKFDIAKEDSVWQVFSLIDNFGAVNFYNGVLDRILDDITLIRNRHLALTYAFRVYRFTYDFSYHERISDEQGKYGLEVARKLLNYSKKLSLPTGYIIPEIRWPKCKLSQVLYLRKWSKELEEKIKSGLPKVKFIHQYYTKRSSE